ncbi:hypothetical protein [Pedosphaera parvula]|uniref:Uncharacterized protein n=1 Tax=Pedosphaera parvula (strain Ellin514) TaxID=320771 RepID=B9XDB5_PEDPL|nr:hypothetical protein [Pedosphaera parvula]EEF62061.1 hypothetical protein Cflav_PD6336 [Pedosphaera parvula Ellin514]
MESLVACAKEIAEGEMNLVTPIAKRENVPGGGIWIVGRLRELEEWGMISGALLVRRARSDAPYPRGSWWDWSRGAHPRERVRIGLDRGHC